MERERERISTCCWLCQNRGGDCEWLGSFDLLGAWE